MSWSRLTRRIAFAGLIAATGTLAGACSFTPVYSSTASKPVAALAYAKPSSRLEQIIYQDLALRIGTTDAPTAPLAQVSVSQSAAVMTRTKSVGFATPYELTVTATLVITPRDGGAAKPQSFTRTATAEYTTTGQVLADNAAQADAGERAARAAAESLRLALLAASSR